MNFWKFCVLNTKTLFNLKVVHDIFIKIMYNTCIIDWLMWYMIWDCLKYVLDANNANECNFPESYERVLYNASIKNEEGRRRAACRCWSARGTPQNLRPRRFATVFVGPGPQPELSATVSLLLLTKTCVRITWVLSGARRRVTLARQCVVV